MFRTRSNFMEALESVRRAGDVKDRIKWRSGAPSSARLVWLSDNWLTEPGQIHSISALLTEHNRQLMRIRVDSENRLARSRMKRVVFECVALCHLMDLLLRSPEYEPEMLELPYQLMHTALGQPRPSWRGKAACRAREIGMRLRDTHISFSHDGNSHAGVADSSSTLCGLGVDIVYLPRLPLDVRYLRRFARSFMASEELAYFEGASDKDDPAQLRIRAAAHFSLMESVSKALGTGLKLGCGIGRSESLPKRSLGVLNLEGETVLLKGTEAANRCDSLNVRELKSHWGVLEDYLVSVVQACRMQPGEAPGWK